MANPDHIAQLMKGVNAWNPWREENPHIYPDLSEANLSWAHLGDANLSWADLSKANLSPAPRVTASPLPLPGLIKLLPLIVGISGGIRRDIVTSAVA
jgi:hypothetical protein